MERITKEILRIAGIVVLGTMVLVGCGDTAPKGESAAPANNAEAQPATEAASAAETSADPMTNKGIGPVKEVQIAAVDGAMAKKGQQIFDAKCSACHKFDKRYVGPALAGVTQRRTPEWIMNQVLNPIEMSQKDPIAKELLATYLTQMTFQDVTESEARELLEYFRQQDAHTTK